jgi:hypothetical protein
MACIKTYTCTVDVMEDASTRLALNLNAFFFFFEAKKAAASAIVNLSFLSLFSAAGNSFLKVETTPPL